MKGKADLKQLSETGKVALFFELNSMGIAKKTGEITCVAVAKHLTYKRHN